MNHDRETLGLQITERNQLPLWLDTLIYKELGGEFRPRLSNMVVLDDDKQKSLNYLGTYFPRSYIEAFNIFSELFNTHAELFEGMKELRLFDFCCGTGGEVIGLLDAIGEMLPAVKSINMTLLDGNQTALRLTERIISEYKKLSKLKIDYKLAAVTIEDFYDMEVVKDVIESDYDIIMTFKAINELVTRERFEQRNAYAYFAETFISGLTERGVMVVEDVTVKAGSNDEWLPIMMDKGLGQRTVIGRNEGFNRAFTVRHSHRSADITKVAYRIITK